MSNGMEKAMKPPCDTKEQPVQTETRDAVEAAIDISKQDREGKWEQHAKQSKRITRWNDNAQDDPSSRS